MIENLILDSELGPDPNSRLATRPEVAAFEAGKRAAGLPEWELSALLDPLTKAERECFELGRETALDGDDEDEDGEVWRGGH